MPFDGVRNIREDGADFVVSARAPAQSGLDNASIAAVSRAVAIRSMRLMLVRQHRLDDGLGDAREMIGRSGLFLHTLERKIHRAGERLPIVVELFDFVITDAQKIRRAATSLWL